jgi:hypothetical protein
MADAVVYGRHAVGQWLSRTPRHHLDLLHLVVKITLTLLLFVNPDLTMAAQAPNLVYM